MLNTLQQMQSQQTPLNNLQQIKSMMNAVRNSSNPQGMLNAMIQQNPNLQKAQEMINACGGDGREAFYQLARQKGMTDQQITEFLTTLNSL